MSAQFVYHFEWDAVKARTNLKKHAVSFRSATAVFRDPLALTTYDDEHSEGEALGDPRPHGARAVPGGDPYLRTGG